MVVPNSPILENEVDLGKYGFVGVSQAFREIQKSVTQIVRYRLSPVLITGETGTGKDLLAYIIHRLLYGEDAPFVLIDLASMRPETMEVELFGSVKGAFTDAVTRNGLLKSANRGTAFLNEIGTLPLDTQKRFLRLIESGKYRKVGGNQDFTFTGFFVIATNEDLEKMVSEGKFRKDLYFRIARHRIHIPPLRERQEDIPVIAKYHFQKFTEKLGKPIRIKDESIFEPLKDYSWPGNVRELVLTLERVIVLVDGNELAREHIQRLFNIESSIRQRLEEPSYQARLRNIVEECVTEVQGNLLQASQKLGLTVPVIERILAGEKPLEAPEGPVSINHGFLIVDLNRVPLSQLRETIAREVVKLLGNKREAARILGISYPTLWRILKGKKTQESSE